MVRVLKILAPISLISLLALAGCADSNGAAQTSGGSGALERATGQLRGAGCGQQGRSGAPFPVELRAIGTGQAFKTVSVESQVAGIVKEVHYRQGQFDSPGRPADHAGQEPFSRGPGAGRSGTRQGQSASPTQPGGTAALQRTRQARNHFQAAVRAISGHLNAPCKPPCRPMKQPSRRQKYNLPTAPFTLPSVVWPELSSSIREPRSRRMMLPVLVVINQVSPIYVDFAVPQQYLGSIKRFMARSHLKVAGHAARRFGCRKRCSDLRQ